MNFFRVARYVLCLIIPFTFSITTYAEVVLDGTLGAKGAIAGPNYNITSTMGQTYGSNLFHSFNTFNLNNTESAIFTGPSTVTNIISRVTGGQQSTIDGTIKSNIAGADFWFINPSGIVFGQNAKLDVGGSFHASTADYIKLGDNNRFDALNSAPPLLTSAPLFAFGFLRSNPGSITLKDGAFLKVSEGKTLSLVGGNIDIQNANLYASAGTINLVSVASAGEAIVDKQNFKVDSFSKLGDIYIKETRAKPERPAYDFECAWKMANIDTSGIGGGNIFIRGGKFFVDGGRVYADTHGDINGKGIDILATDSVTISGALQGGIASGAIGEGHGGSINIVTTQLNISEGSFIAANAENGSTGNGGNITIKAADSVTVSGTGSTIQSGTLGEGTGGTINIETARLDMSGGVNIAASAESGSKGNAGNITIKATDSVTLSGTDSTIQSRTRGEGNAGNINVYTTKLNISDGAEISANASFGSKGHGGDISIKATDSVNILGGWGIESFTLSEGNAGNISIETAKLNISDSAHIATDAGLGSKGKGGEITITATDSVNISGVLSKIDSGTSGEGKSGSISIATPSLNISDGAYISTSCINGDGGYIQIKATDSVNISGAHSNISAWTFGDGKAGSISVETAKLNIADSANIATNASGDGTGAGGNITIKATDSVNISKLSSIQGATLGDGNAGNISIETAKLDILDGAYIATNTGFGKGHGGDITIKADTSVNISGNNSGLGSSISAWTLGDGDAGSISMGTAKLHISDGAKINTSAAGGRNSNGDGGNISIKATDSIDISGQFIYGTSSYSSSIRSNTNDKGRGGTISVNTGILNLYEGGEISAKSTGAGNAGDIDIKTFDTVQLVDSSITTASDSAGGGQINITAGRMINLINSEITATVAGGTGNGGNVEATAPFFILNKGMVTAQADKGKGGNISLKTDTYIQTQDSVVSASSRLGIDGTVITSSPAIDLSGTVALLQTAYIDTAALAPKQCVEREEELSSFVIKGRDGLPPFPDSLLAIP